MRVFSSMFTSHDENIVYSDLINSDKLLVSGGLIILDDVLHTGVKAAILKFLKSKEKTSNYFRVSVDERNGSLKKEAFLYDRNVQRVQARKRSFDDPSTMFCIRKE